MLPGNKWMKPPTKWLVIWKMLIILKNSDIDWYDFLTQHWQIRALRPSLTGRLFLQIKFYWDTATPPFIYIICGCFGTTGRVEYLRQRVYNPQSLIFLLPHPLGKKNLTAAALIPCYTEWGSRTDTITLAYLKCRIWGSTPKLNQNLHCNKIPKWDSMTLKPGKHCHGVFHDDRNAHPLHWCKFHPTPSYQHRNSKQWLSTLVKSESQTELVRNIKSWDLPPVILIQRTWDGVKDSRIFKQVPLRRSRHNWAWDITLETLL